MGGWVREGGREEGREGGRECLILPISPQPLELCVGIQEAEWSALFAVPKSILKKRHPKVVDQKHTSHKMGKGFPPSGQFARQSTIRRCKDSLDMRFPWRHTEKTQTPTGTYLDLRLVIIPGRSVPRSPPRSQPPQSPEFLFNSFCFCFGSPP